MQSLSSVCSRLPKCLFRSQSRRIHTGARKTLLTLAIETSCDDTCVAVVERRANNSARIHFNEKLTSDNRIFGGINPLVAGQGHEKNLAKLVNQAIHSLPEISEESLYAGTGIRVREADNGPIKCRKKPDFVTVTRGPGMRSCLNTGLNTAKGLATAWQIPFLGVNHMEAHALTPRLLSSLPKENFGGSTIGFGGPKFPFLTLLVSGGHTMLVHSKGLCNHHIIATTTDMAIGNCLDKCATDILPLDIRRGAKNVMFGPLLENFGAENGPSPEYVPMQKSLARPQSGAGEGYDWIIQAPYTNPGPDGQAAQAHNFTYSGIGSAVRQIMQRKPTMDDQERRSLARAAMTIAFEHLASRILYALQDPELASISTLVVSGGVACNLFLKEILSRNLEFRGFPNIKIVFPDPKYCTDNAAMIGWTGIELFDAGWRSTPDATSIKTWSIDPNTPGGGIIGAGGWQHTGWDESGWGSFPRGATPASVDEALRERKHEEIQNASQRETSGNIKVY